MQLKEFGNAHSVQQTSDIFLALLATLPGQKNSIGVVINKSVDGYTNNI